MNLQDLRALVAVADAGTLSRAAERLRVAQPALTKRVQGLERALGVVLLERLPRGVRLTDAGRAFVDAARGALAQAQGAADAARRAATGEVGRLTIGYTDLAVYSGHLPTAACAFRARYPDVELTLAPQRTPGAARDAFDVGALDVVLVQRWAADIPEEGTPRAAGLADPGDPAVRTLVLVECAMGAFLPAGHRLAGAPALRTRDLAGEPFVMLPAEADRAFVDQFRRACAAAGLRPHVVQEATDLPTLLGLVATGAGVKLGPRAHAVASPPGVVCVPVVDFPLRQIVDLGWREAPGARAASNFAHVAVACADGGPSCPATGPAGASEPSPTPPLRGGRREAGGGPEVASVRPPARVPTGRPDQAS